MFSNSSYNYFTKLIQAIIFADDAVSMNFGYMLAYNGSSNLRYIKFPKNYTNSIYCGNLNYAGFQHYVDCTNYNELINKASNLHQLRILVNYIRKKLTVNNLNASVWSRDAFYGIFEEIEINNLNVLTYFDTAFSGTIVKKVTINTQINATEMASAFNSCTVKEIIGTEYLGSRTSDVNGTDMFSLCANLTSPIIMYAKFTKFGCYGTSIRRQPITSIRLMNPNSTFSGTSPQIDVSYNSLDATALNTLFGDLPVLSGKTIKITGNPGAGTCDTSIATSKGWTVQN